jgi:DNA-binding NarL/FixJ family response regulator
MAIRRVFVVWQHPLILMSLRGLLNHASIEWVGDSSTLDDLPQLVVENKPDIILIEGEVDENTQKALHLLETSKRSLRIIALNLSRNEIQLYELEQETINQKEDLLNLILKE